MPELILKCSIRCEIEGGMEGGFAGRPKQLHKGRRHENEGPSKDRSNLMWLDSWACASEVARNRSEERKKPALRVCSIRF